MERAGGPSDPSVSVVIPTYDRPAPLERAIESARSQDITPHEIIVIDDGSPDPIRTELELSDDTRELVTVVRHAENLGPNMARTTGIRRATGTHIAFLDDDDQWHHTKLAKQVRRLDDEVGLVSTGQEYRTADGDTIGYDIPTTSGDPTASILRGYTLGPFSTLLVEQSVIEAAGPPDPDLPSFQDWEWTIRLSQHTAVDIVQSPLVYRNIGEANRVGEEFAAKRAVTYPRMLEQHRKLAASFGVRCERQYQASLATAVASAALAAGEYRCALRLSLRAIRNAPWYPRAYVYLLAAGGGDPTYRAARTIRRFLAQRAAKTLHGNGQ